MNVRYRVELDQPNAMNLLSGGPHAHGKLKRTQILLLRIRAPVTRTQGASGGSTVYRAQRRFMGNPEAAPGKEPALGRPHALRQTGGRDHFKRHSSNAWPKPCRRLGWPRVTLDIPVLCTGPR
jgi:hypothetical protein